MSCAWERLGLPRAFGGIYHTGGVVSRSLRVDMAVLCALATATSILAYVFFHKHGTILGYQDTLSHLMIGRRVVVGEQTGVGQLGGIWLPLPHLLISTLAWSDSMYLSGLAGSVFSMTAHVGTVIGLYALVRVATGDRVAGWVAAAVFGLGANALYLQSTPMSEPLMYLGIVLSVLAVLLWHRTDRHRWLFLGATISALLVFVQYEAWVFSAALWLVVVHICIVKRHRFFTGDLAGQAYVLVFGFYLALGAGLWLLWNLVVLGHQPTWPHQTSVSTDQVIDLGLSQVGDLRVSVLTFGYAVRDTVGWPVAALALVGLTLMAWRERLSPVFTLFLTTSVPGIFLVYGIYSGTEQLTVAEVDGSDHNLWMAVVMALPCALFIGYLVSLAPSTLRWGAGTLRITAVASLLVIASAATATAVTTNGRSVVTNQEAAAQFTSSAEQREVGTFIRDHTSGAVLVELVSNEWVVFPIQQRVVDEGSGERWLRALVEPGDPSLDIDVVVMRTSPGRTDTVHDRLSDDPAMAEYEIVQETAGYLVWERRSPTP